MSIGSNLRSLRQRSHLSQLEFAKIANVTGKAVSEWEHDKKIPRMDALQRIADHFGIKKSYLIEDNGVNDFFEDNIKPPKKTSISDDETDLLYRYRRLDQNARNAIWSMIKAFDERDSQQPQQSQLAI